MKSSSNIRRLLSYTALTTTILFNSQVCLGNIDHFWKTQKKGANFFNRTESKERLLSASDFGFNWIRLTPSKWDSPGPHKEPGSFFNARHSVFTPPHPDDIRQLKAVLDQANTSGLKVVLTFLTIPGRIWSQHNKGVQVRKIWSDFKAQDEAIKFWAFIAKELKGHPAIAGYNLLNEPSPEFLPPRAEDWAGTGYLTWYQKIKGTPQDLNLFYKKAVSEIRKSDQNAWIMLDSGFFATPWAFKVLEPLDDPRILYSFHMYEPYSYTFSHKKVKAGLKPLDYPGPAVIGESEKTGKKIVWDQKSLSEFFQPVRDWQKAHNIPSWQIVAGEFGVNRTAPGAAGYFSDLLTIFDKEGWHWALYSWREDEWDAMDYELGTGKAPYRYWQSIEKGTSYEYPKNLGPFVPILRDSLQKSKPAPKQSQPKKP